LRLFLRTKIVCAGLRLSRRFLQETAIQAITPQLRRKILAPVAHVKDRIRQMPGRAVLKKIRVGAGAHYFANNLVVGSARENNDLRAQHFSPNTPDKLNAMQLGQVQIDHGDLGPKLPDLSDGSLPVRALRHDFKLGVPLQHGSEAVASEGVLIGQQNRYFFRGRH
jgi:hypothetical protein